MSPTPPAENRPRRAGTGGRWRIYLGRGVLWAAIVVLAINGIVHQAQMWTGSSPAAGEDEQDTVEEENTGFPEEAAGAFAADFAEVYLAEDEETQDGQVDEDETRLAEFVPEDEANSFTLAEDVTGQGARVVQIRAQDEHRGVVTLSTRVNGEPMHLEVPVYADSAEALVVADIPALLPAPEQASLPETEENANDSETAEAMRPVVEGFLAAWAETPEHLDRYTHPDADITPLPEGVFEFASADLTVPRDGGSDALVQAEVTWQPAGGSDTLVQRYELDMVETGGSWYVQDIQGTAPAPSS